MTLPYDPAWWENWSREISKAPVWDDPIDLLSEIVMPFGKHKGKRLAEIPLSYLRDIVDVRKLTLGSPARPNHQASKANSELDIHRHIAAYLQHPLLALSREVGE